MKVLFVGNSVRSCEITIPDEFPIEYVAHCVASDVELSELKWAINTLERRHSQLGDLYITDAPEVKDEFPIALFEAYGFSPKQVPTPLVAYLDGFQIKTEEETWIGDGVNDDILYQKWKPRLFKKGDNLDLQLNQAGKYYR